MQYSASNASSTRSQFVFVRGFMAVFIDEQLVDLLIYSPESRPLQLKLRDRCMATTRPDSKTILQSLVQGVDPSTGADLHNETILQRADVMRALLAGVAALHAKDMQAKRRAALPPNVGRTWSAKEHEELVEAFQGGESIGSIAAKHGRSVRAIEARLHSHGLIESKDRTTHDRFSSE